MYDQLFQYGVIGIVLAWFMLRSEQKTDALTKALNNSNKVVLCLVEAVSGCPGNANSDGATGKKIRQDQIESIKEDILKA